MLKLLVFSALKTDIKKKTFLLQIFVTNQKAYFHCGHVSSALINFGVNFAHFKLYFGIKIAIKIDKNK